MYQNCCKECGSTSLHTEVKGSNTGLYCDDCGAWVKWLSKDELRAFEYSQKQTKTSQKSEMYKEVKRRIGFYREKKENNIFDDFYHSHLDYIEKCMEYYEENNRA